MNLSTALWQLDTKLNESMYSKKVDNKDITSDEKYEIDDRDEDEEVGVGVKVQDENDGWVLMTCISIHMPICKCMNECSAVLYCTVLYTVLYCTV